MGKLVNPEDFYGTSANAGVQKNLPRKLPGSSPGRSTTKFKKNRYIGLSAVLFQYAFCSLCLGGGTVYTAV